MEGHLETRGMWRGRGRGENGGETGGWTEGEIEDRWRADGRRLKRRDSVREVGTRAKRAGTKEHSCEYEGGGESERKRWGRGEKGGVERRE